MTTRWARIARGTTAAVVSTFVAVFFHGIAGGPVPAATGLLVCVVFSALVCIALAGVTLSRIRLAISVVASQFLFHGLFIMFTGTGGAVGGTGGGHVHGAEALAAQLAALERGGASGYVHSDMWLSHALAAAVTFVALRYGERSFWALLELGRLMAKAIVRGMPQRTPPVGRGVSLVDLVRSERPRTRKPLLSVLRHRGPPALVST